MSNQYASYEVSVVKQRKDEEPLAINLRIAETDIHVFREAFKDLASKGWEINILRETYLPWDLEEV